jgi:hypothetical protein
MGKQATLQLGNKHWIFQIHNGQDLPTSGVFFQACLVFLRSGVRILFRHLVSMGEFKV